MRKITWLLIWLKPPCSSSWKWFYSVLYFAQLHKRMSWFRFQLTFKHIKIKLWEEAKLSSQLREMRKTDLTIKRSEKNWPHNWEKWGMVELGVKEAKRGKRGEQKFPWFCPLLKKKIGCNWKLNSKFHPPWWEGRWRGGILLLGVQALASPRTHLRRGTRESYLGPRLLPFRWFQFNSVLQKCGSLFWLVQLYQIILFVTLISVFSTVVELSNSDNARARFFSW